MKRMIDYAMREWNIYLPKGNPFSRVTLPSKGDARDRRLKAGEFERILNQALEYGGQLPVLFELAIETAMRRGELISLEWKHVDLHKRTAHVNIPFLVAA
jgi:integrase